MSLKHKFTKTLIEKFGKPRINRLIAKRKSLSAMPGILLPTSNIPTRFDIPFEMMKLFQERDDIEMKYILELSQFCSSVLAYRSTGGA